MSSRKTKPRISVVCPVHDNAPQLKQFTREVASALPGYRVEIILVDDGSTDNSWEVIQSLAQAAGPGIQVAGLRLARNFGQHNAIVAGLQNAKGELVVVMDADLQDNPAYIPGMISLLRPGIDVIHTRRQRNIHSLKDIVSYVAHRVLSVFSEIRYHSATGNFKLLSRRAVITALKYRAPQPVFEVMVERAGYGASVIDVVRRPREANASSYSLMRSLRFMSSLMLSYSSLPAIVCVSLAVLQLAGALLLFIVRAQDRREVFILVFAGQGILFLVLGLILMYMREIQRAARGWPAYDIVETTNRVRRTRAKS